MADDSGGPAPGAEGDADAPSGDVYDWYTRGLELLDGRSPAAAVQLLARAAEAVPDSRSIREALARAQFDARMYADAFASFRIIVAAKPDDDYAQYGAGLSAARLGDLTTAIKHLALAVAMRPETRHYRSALREARATLRAQSPRDDAAAPDEAAGSQNGPDPGAPGGGPGTSGASDAPGLPGDPGIQEER